MEAWTDLYTETAERVNTKLPEIEWIDLWHDQVSYLTDELPFPTPALFIGFNTNRCDDRGLLIQDCDLQVDMYLFFETFSDTYDGSYNRAGAIDFLRLLTKIHAIFHGYSGVNFGTMRRVDMKREESGGAGNLYRISFATSVEDASAKAEFDQQTVNEITIVKTADTGKPSTQDEEPMFILPG